MFQSLIDNRLTQTVTTLVKNPVSTTLALTAGLTLGVSGIAQAAVITLTFEGVGDLQQVADFYNGGPGGDYGISFGSDALALIDEDAGGVGNIANEPSPDTVLFFLGGPGAIMNVADGFTEGFSFNYSTVSLGGLVTVYDGIDGTGNILASLNLAALGSAGNGDPTGAYDTWRAIGISFSGVAKSVNFSGGANFIIFDNITLGSEIPGGNVTVPEPASILGLLAVGGLGLIKKRKKEN